MTIRILAALAAGLTALTGVLIAYPGDAVSQEWLLASIAASAVMNAVVWSLMGQPKASAYTVATTTGDSFGIIPGGSSITGITVEAKEGE